MNLEMNRPGFGGRKPRAGRLGYQTAFRGEVLLDLDAALASEDTEALAKVNAPQPTRFGHIGGRVYQTVFIPKYLCLFLEVVLRLPLRRY